MLYTDAGLLLPGSMSGLEDIDVLIATKHNRNSLNIKRSMNTFSGSNAASKSVVHSSPPIVFTSTEPV